MPEEKTCPFFYVAPYTQSKHCNKSECQLWSTETSMCSITAGMLALLSAADALRGILQEIKSHYPE
ncbi:unnamed protein product [marine sediment metagenome]|uniref:Uncharacterized protein n=1 Tax=marine sediment metagenome TaxID=412755 RepID=X1I065_9ZZZZ